MYMYIVGEENKVHYFCLFIELYVCAVFLVRLPIRLQRFLNLNCPQVSGGT